MFLSDLKYNSNKLKRGKIIRYVHTVCQNKFQTIFIGAKEIFDGLKFFGIFDFVNWLNDCVWNPNFGPLLSPTFHLDTVKYVYDSDRYV